MSSSRAALHLILYFLVSPEHHKVFDTTFIVMSVQGHAVHALTRTMLDADQVAALATPTNPASVASMSKVNGMVAGYVHKFMDDLKRRYDVHLAKGNHVKVQYYGGLLNSIAI